MRPTQTTDVLSKVPVAQLRIFEASARRNSLQAAAAELHLTPSAVSHAIRKMEHALGVVLFERSGRNLNLSAEGEALMRHVAPAFAELRRGIEMVSTRGPQLLRLHSAPSFATQWLAPRLKQFLAECPEVDMRLAAGTDYARFTSDDEYDADIIYGLPRAPNVSVLPLGKETVTPLCTPRLAKSIHSPVDLLEQNLIQSDNKQVHWPDWFALNGLAAPPARGFGSIAASLRSQWQSTGWEWRSSQRSWRNGRLRAAAWLRRCWSARRASTMSDTIWSRPRAFTNADLSGFSPSGCRAS